MYRQKNRTNNVHGNLRDRALSGGEYITAPELTKRRPQPEESNKTEARDVKTYSHLPPSGSGVGAETFAEADVVQFTPLTV